VSRLLFAFWFLIIVLPFGEAHAFVDFCAPWQETIKEVLGLSPDLVERFEAVQIDPVALVCAVIDQESDGNARAQQFEASFYKRHVKKKAHVRRDVRRMRDRLGYTTYQRAARAYSSSYGLTQILYASAQVEGFRDHPNELKDPVFNLYVASRHLFRKFQRARRYHPNGDSRETLLWTLRFWNGSPNVKETLQYALSVERQYLAYRTILEREDEGGAILSESNL